MKIIYSCILNLAVALVSTHASARERQTSVGRIDSSCVTEVPKGATVDAATGRVTRVDGSSYATSTCDESWTPAHPRPAEVGGGAAEVQNLALAQADGFNAGNDYGVTNDWVMFSSANAIALNGMATFDDMQQNIFVPDAPQNASDAGSQYLWCGLENLTSGGDWATLIQAYIVWGEIPGTWALQTAYVPNPSYVRGNVFTSVAEPVAPGDRISCQVSRIQVGEWQITATDTASGAWSRTNLVPASGNGALVYNWALLAVYEAFPVGSCAGMPFQGYGVVDRGWLRQAGPVWNAEANVVGQVAVHTFAATCCCDNETFYEPIGGATFFSFFNGF
jgi:hypothetical protein